MIILSYSSGAKRVELQEKPMTVPKTAWATMSPGDQNQLKNVNTKYGMLVWNGDVLVTFIPVNAWQGIFNLYRVRVQQETGDVIPDFVVGKRRLQGGKIV